MMIDLQRLKAALRSEVRARVAELSGDARAAASAKLRDQLRTSEIWQRANSVLFFAPLADEPDLWPLMEESLRAEKLVGLPRFDPTRSAYVAGRVEDLLRDIQVGKYQIREPAQSCLELDLSGVDLVLVPGVAFDRQRRRLGRGRGFYDRLLMNVRGLKCGVAFEEQWVEEVPAEAHDTRMDAILTPTHWIKAGN